MDGETYFYYLLFNEGVIIKNFVLAGNYLCYYMTGT